MSKVSKFIPFILIICMVVMVLFPRETASGTSKAINLWLLNIVPTMLPFFILSKTLNHLDVSRKLPMNLYPFTMALFSGYPVGAVVASDYYKENRVSLEEFYYILSFSMVTGPAFIAGVLGIQFMNSFKWGIVIGIGHYLGAVCNGLLYKQNTRQEKKLFSKEAKYSSSSYFDALTKGIQESFKGIAIILAYIVIFMVIIEILKKVGLSFLIKLCPQPFEKIMEGLTYGILEMTIGCSTIGKAFLGNLYKATLLSFLVSFGGLSVFGQTISMIGGFKVNPLKIFKIKVTHGILASVITFCIGVMVLQF